MWGMSTEHIIAIALFGVLVFSILGSLLTRRGAVRNGLVWLLIFGGAFVASGEWDNLRPYFEPQPTFSEARIEVPKGPDNHFRLTLQINDVPVDFLVDTGASQVVLTRADAARVGYNPEDLAFIGTAFTANGEVATAPVRLDSVVLGDIRDTRVRASVNGGDMESSLLGMSYLGRFESIEIRRDVLILNR